MRCDLNWIDLMHSLFGPTMTMGFQNRIFSYWLFRIMGWGNLYDFYGSDLVCTGGRIYIHRVAVELISVDQETSTGPGDVIIFLDDRAHRMLCPGTGQIVGHKQIQGIIAGRRRKQPPFIIKMDNGVIDKVPSLD